MKRSEYLEKLRSENTMRFIACLPSIAEEAASDWAFNSDEIRTLSSAAYLKSSGKNADLINRRIDTIRETYRFERELALDRIVDALDAGDPFNPELFCETLPEALESWRSIRTEPKWDSE